VTLHETGTAGFNALLYTPPSQPLIDYIGRHVNAAMEATGTLGQRFVDNVKSIYNRFGSERSILDSKRLLAQTGPGFRDDVIYNVGYNDLGNANLWMQHYIMANPRVGDLYSKGMCHGYADTYINSEKDTYGENTMLYMDVMDGVYDLEKDTLHHYYHTEMSDNGMDTVDKMSVLNTWDNVVESIFKGLDPTDPDKGSL